MKTALRKTVLLPLLLLWFISLNAQELSKTGFIRAVREADLYYYYDQNYEKAAELFESLLKIYPDNSNLISKLGICYLNLDGKSPDALKLLSKASLNIVSSDKEYAEYGEKAPLDTYLYLAVAYHQNDSLQKALTLYYDAKKKLKDTQAFREDYIDLQIRDCRYALEMKKKPYTIITSLFTDWLNDYPGACNPALAKNDSVFVFTQKENGKTRILCSYKSGTWQRPLDITQELGGYDRFYTNSITGDGKLLIIYMDDGGDGNLYYSQRKDSVWSRIKSLGKPINSIYWQSHGFITPDGQTIYYSSNQPGGEGELDIWYSEKTAAGKWGEPVNCGNVINTPFNEDTPFFDQETGALLFSSVGHISMGGYDVFRSVKKNGSWTTPIGMPYSFNNTMNNNFFILNNNTPGFITSYYDVKTKARNIYAVVAENPADKITLAKGTITLEDGMAVDPGQVHIWLVSSKGKTPENINLSDSSSFDFEVKPGDYQLFVNHQGYKTDTINLNIPLFYSASYVSVNASLIPDKVFGGEFLSIDNILFEFNSSELSDEAKSRLDLLKSILINYPELKVEVAGYTDNKGTREYNIILADKRAQNVINYLATSPASSLKFVKKSFGKSAFAAVNNNADGSDNPEGRRYNRRVTFGIIDPKTGIVIRQETYTPEHLRQPNSLRYSIVLLKTAKKPIPGYFSSLIKDDLLFIRTINMDTVSMYTLGVFYNKNDALKYLDYVRESGFTKAYILDQYELNNESKLNLTPEEKEARSAKIDQRIYSIQLKATRNPLDIGRIFSGIEGVKERKSSDGFYKYYCGEYLTQPKAREALLAIKKSGFEDAFIVKLFELDNDSNINLNAGEDKAISGKIGQGLYTIQLKATKNPLDIGRVFAGMEGVKAIKSSDGFYKYYYGEYSELSKANEALLAIKKLGYGDAFVKYLY